MMLTAEESRKFWPRLKTQLRLEEMMPFMQNSFLLPGVDGLSVVASCGGSRVRLNGMCTVHPETRNWPGSQTTTQSTDLNFENHCPAVQAQRCGQLGQTISQCVTAFMARLKTVAGQTLPISMEDLAAVGGDVVLSSKTGLPVCRDENARRITWLDKINVTMCVRDAFLTHTDQRILHDAILPLVITQIGPSRTLVIVDGPCGIVPGQPHFFELKDLTPKSARHALKATHALCVVSTHLIRELEQAFTKVGKRLASYGKLSHKLTRQKLGLSTVVFDLPWDNVIACCQQPVPLPRGHDIGFWWTLCTPDVVVGEIAWTEKSLAPLSTVHCVHPKMYPWVAKRLNRHRMVDLSLALNDVIQQ